MCQILFKPKGYMLREDLLYSTCTVNGDGFGFMYHDGTDLISDKLFTGGNSLDIDKVREVLSKLVDVEAYIHFRYRTRGNEDTESCHPFLIYNENGRQVYLMHNGTLSGFGSETKVDSQDFGEQMVAPLYDLQLKAGIANPLKDEFFFKVLDKFVGYDSKIVLMDNLGDTVIFNEAKGKIYHDEKADQKFWVSNTYSFDEKWREPVKHTPTTHSMKKVGTSWVYANHGGASNEVAPFCGKGAAKAGTLVVPTQNLIPELPWVTPTSKSSNSQNATIAEVDYTRKMKLSYWQDVLQLDSVFEVLDMDEESIGELCLAEPHHAEALIRDLIWELKKQWYGYDDGDYEEDEVNAD